MTSPPASGPIDPEPIDPESIDPEPPSLEELVETLTAPIVRRRRVGGGDMRDRVTVVLKQLVEYFGVDAAFLRRNDHDRRQTILVAEWPPRASIPEPDPLAVIRFDEADEIFRVMETQRDIRITGPANQSPEYTEMVIAASGHSSFNTLTVPLLVQDVTAGIVGLSHFGVGRRWTSEEIDAVRGVAQFLSF